MKKTLLTIAAMALAICAANAQPGGMRGFGQRPQIDVTFNPYVDRHRPQSDRLPASEV